MEIASKVGCRKKTRKKQVEECVKVGLSKEDALFDQSGLLVLIRLPLGRGKSKHHQLLGNYWTLNIGLFL